MIRLYGSSIGHGSFCRVALGMKGALSDLGQLAGFVPVDAFDEEASYPGHNADVGVFVGPPDRVGMMTAMGWHKERLALLPANSTWMPKALIEGMEKHVTGWLAPSAWAAGVLRGYTQLPVSVWRHGVAEDFKPEPVDRAARTSDYNHGYFCAGHLASTHMQRKGTRELIRAWCRVVKDGGFLGVTHPLLTLVVDGPHDVFAKDITEIAGGDKRVVESVQRTRQRWNMDPMQAAHWYRKQHLIAQPSRGEGFGMVPLEALACGVPVLMTACTGHSEFITQTTSFAHVITGDLAPIDDGPGAMAPSLREDDVYAALVKAYVCWKKLADDGAFQAGRVEKNWNWTEVTRQWLKERS